MNVPASLTRLAFFVTLGLLMASCGPSGPRRPSAAAGKPNAKRRPNIVIILADDLGHGDLGVTGAPDIRTPRLDRLASEGVRFTHAYANAPVCSPTRAALLSGQYQQRAGVGRVIYANERELGLSHQVELLPAYLRKAGYATGIIGKWHLGYPKTHFPTRFGFDEFTGFVAGNIDYFAHTDRLGNADLWRGEEAITDDRYFTDLIADEAIDFINRHEDEPFFLYLPFNAPHDPFQGPEHRDTAGNQEVTRKVNRTREVLRAMIESLDANIGRVLDRLDETDLGANTAIFFFSDNGGVRSLARNAPFRGHKATLWEGGIRTPFFARFTGRFPAGTTVADMVIGMDLFPTALALAGVTPPADRPMDGLNLLPLIEGKQTLKRDTLYFRYEGPRGPVQRAVVQKGWKYLSDEKEQEHLFRLSDVPPEQDDLAASQAARLAELRNNWQAWERDVMQGAPRLPSPKR